MKVLTVRVTGLGPGASEIVLGYIALIDGKLVGSNGVMQRNAGYSLALLNDEIDPKKEPERFLRSMHLYYYVFCSTPLRTPTTTRNVMLNPRNRDLLGPLRFALLK